ncbi:MAG: alpha/beta hydrolase [Polyangia bacterium]
MEITYRLVDDVGGSGRALVMSGGLGGTHLVWTALVRALRRDFRIVIWDYPGLTAGETLDERVPVDIQSLASYQAELLDHLGWERAVLVGWSLGTQVAAELIRERADRCEALVAICGVDGRPFVETPNDDPLAASLGLRSSVPGAVSWLSERMDRIETLRGMLRRIERPTRWAKRLGLVDPLVDDLVFDAVIRDFIALDPGVYRRYVEAAAEHDASDLRGRVDRPVLAIAGERDRMVPPARVREMAREIPGADYLEVRGATHFLPLEYPDHLVLEIESFLERHRES